jgi:UDP-N-acetylglucosamine--N-acetylmuramyl-(pentapeptide) pyrophosphoryl-undecaprenol N-acetylglucosamine transferase
MIAVAEAVRALSPELRIVFVGTARGMETRAVPERGFELRLLDVAPIRGAGLAGALRGVARAAKSIPEARALLRELEPRAVFSIGGYAAGPIALAARFLGIPVALMEPNSVIGLANRLMAPLVARAYTAFPEAERHFAQNVVLRTGVPLRSGFSPRPYRRNKKFFRVLVLGGSQGARALNETVPDALALAKTPVEVVHQCGRGNDAGLAERYAGLGARGRANVVPFIDDMPSALAAAELVVGRAGASAVGEICAVGRPSLLVPYPHAAGDHQRKNAESLQAAGGAVCVASDEATAERIAADIDRLAETPGLLERMADAARERGRPDAAFAVARDLLELSSVHKAQAVTGPPERAPDRGESGLRAVAQEGV